MSSVLKQQTKIETEEVTNVHVSDQEQIKKFELIAMSNAIPIDHEDYPLVDECTMRKNRILPFLSKWAEPTPVTTIVDSVEPLIPGMVKVSPILHRYIMSKEIENEIRVTPYKFGYGGFSEAVYYRTYSRLKKDGTKEDFPDTIIRVVEGIISIAKDWRVKHSLEWDQGRWDDLAVRFGKAMLKMHFLPPGRGLWISGTEYSYQRGSVAFNNCGFCSLKEGLIKSATFIIDSLMSGCGLGFDTFEKTDSSGRGEFSDFVRPGCSLCRSSRTHDEIHSCNCHCEKRVYKIHDSREGWTKSMYLLLESYFNGVVTYFDYSGLRPEGKPIKGFGGTSSGPEPLRILHERIRLFIECYMDVNISNADKTQLTGIDGTIMAKHDAIIKMTKKHIDIYPETNITERPSLIWALSELEKMDHKMRSSKSYGASRLICDIFNAIGICVIAGNVRRSSEIALGAAADVEFRNLKNHELNPERSIISWMSNNTVCLDKKEDFELLPEISQRIRDNGEPGILNRLNGTRYGRFGRREPIGREAEEDNAIGVNPCSEILLESYEYCNLAEVFPSKCDTQEEVEEATYLATIYTSTVSLLATHWIPSNKVIARNRRIGVSMSGIVEDIARSSNTLFTKKCRRLYRLVRETNKAYADENGVPESIRVTTVKPSGSISQLAGCSSGIHHNTYKYCIRRVRMSANIKLVEILKAAGYPYEIDRKAGEGTLIFSFPLYQGDARSAEEVSVWEQASNLAMLQREWADNSVSCTLYFNPEIEGPSLEHLLSHFAPVIKCLSALPHSGDNVYDQAPYEKITEEQYHTLSASIKPINFSNLDDEAEGTRGCDSDVCAMNSYKLASNDPDRHKNKRARV